MSTGSRFTTCWSQRRSDGLGSQSQYIKNVLGHKTDSAWICKLLLAGLLKPSYIPAKEQRNLRDLTRYRTRLIQSVASNKNRRIRILEDENIKLTSVLSDMDGVVATCLVDKLCETGKVTMEEIEEVITASCRQAKKNSLMRVKAFLKNTTVICFRSLVKKYQVLRQRLPN